MEGTECSDVGAGQGFQTGEEFFLIHREMVPVLEPQILGATEYLLLPDLFFSYLVDGCAENFHDVEFVEGDRRIRKSGLHAPDKRRRHIDGRIGDMVRYTIVRNKVFFELCY